MLHVSQMFFKIAGKSNNYQFYLPDFLEFWDNISHNLLRTSRFLEKFMKILEWSTLQKQISPLHSTQCCSILEEQQLRSLYQETVSDTCKQHWKWGGGGLVSEFMWGIVTKRPKLVALQTECRAITQSHS